MGVGEAIKWTFDKIKAMIWTPLSFLIMMLVLLVFVVLGLLFCNIPGLGPLCFSVFYVFFYILAILLLIIFIIFCFSIFLYPSIIAVEEESASGAIATVCGVIRNKGYMVLLCFVTGVILALLLAYVLGLITLGGASFLVTLADNKGDVTLMGEQFEKIQSSVPFMELINTLTQKIFLGIGQKFEALFSFLPVPNIFRSLNGVFENLVVPTDTGDNTDSFFNLVGFIYGINLLVIYVFTLAYPFVLLNCAGTLTYLIVREENEWEDFDFEEPSGETDTVDDLPSGTAPEGSGTPSEDEEQKDSPEDGTETEVDQPPVTEEEPVEEDGDEQETKDKDSESAEEKKDEDAENGDEEDTSAENAEDSKK